MIESSRSFGMVMTVSTHSRSASSPASACSARFLPSNLNGLVTTAIVSAPSSLARLAITGAAPVPVPPPRPVVTKIMSAPDNVWMMLSVSSSAAWRPMFGSAPAPSPFVSLWPICSFMAALALSSACRSVLATMNSTPPSPTSTMRLTALLPPPPTPITLILAPRRASGAKVMRRSDCSRSRAIQPPLDELFENAPDAPGHPAERARAALGLVGRPVAMGVQRQPHGGRKHGARHVIGQPADAGGMPAADRQVEDLLGDLRHA